MTHIREKLALIWSAACIVAIVVILLKFGDAEGVLTKVLDLLQTVILLLLGFYFGAMYTKAKQVD